MLEITIKPKEGWNSIKEEFVETKPTTICLEHSLVSLSKWESKYKKPFLSSEKTEAEIIDYIKMMTITQNVDDNVYSLLSEDDYKKINDYIADPMTATWFGDNNKYLEGNNQKQPTRSREIITSELIYYWMITYNIPVEICQKWHLNRLLVLIRVCNIKDAQQNGKNGRMSKRDVLSQNKALNAARRQRLGSRG